MPLVNLSPSKPKWTPDKPLITWEDARQFILFVAGRKIGSSTDLNDVPLERLSSLDQSHDFFTAYAQTEKGQFLKVILGTSGFCVRVKADKSGYEPYWKPIGWRVVDKSPNESEAEWEKRVDGETVKPRSGRPVSNMAVNGLFDVLVGLTPSSEAPTKKSAHLWDDDFKFAPPAPPFIIPLPPAPKPLSTLLTIASVAIVDRYILKGSLSTRLSKMLGKVEDAHLQGPGHPVNTGAGI